MMFNFTINFTILVIKVTIHSIPCASRTNPIKIIMVKPNTFTNVRTTCKRYDPGTLYTFNANIKPINRKMNLAISL